MDARLNSPLRRQADFSPEEWNEFCEKSPACAGNGQPRSDAMGCRGSSRGRHRRRVPTPWHQDGRTHWSADGESLAQLDGTGETHGFNLNVSWSHCTPQNCLWVLPGSHRRWLLANGGKFPRSTEVVPEAVPVLMGPGDCALVDRSSLHGSYRNHSPERRVTMVLGYHKRSSALGVSTTNVHAFTSPGGGNIKDITYTEDYVLQRARMIPLAIDARRQFYPDETPYIYRGAYRGNAVWNEQTRAEIATPGDEYWQRDITL